MEDPTIVKAIFEFLKTATPLSVIALLSVIIFQLVRGKSFADIFTKKAQPTQPLDQTVALTAIAEKLEKIASNHLHDLPGIREDVTKILITQGDINKELNNQGQRMVRVETLLGIGVPEQHR